MVPEVFVSKGNNMLMFKSFSLRNFWMASKVLHDEESLFKSLEICNIISFYLYSVIFVFLYKYI